MIYSLANWFPASALTYTYKYDPSGGAGVDVCVVDTGEYHVAPGKSCLFIHHDSRYLHHACKNRSRTLVIIFSLSSSPPLVVACPGEQPSVAMRMSYLPSFPSVINRTVATQMEMAMVPMSHRSIS